MLRASLLLDVHASSWLLVYRSYFQFLTFWWIRFNSRLLRIWDLNQLHIRSARGPVVHSDYHCLLARVHLLAHHELKHVDHERLCQ